jgi:hypothetical protein
MYAATMLPPAVTIHILCGIKTFTAVPTQNNGLQASLLLTQVAIIENFEAHHEYTMGIAQNMGLQHEASLLDYKRYRS